MHEEQQRDGWNEEEEGHTEVREEQQRDGWNEEEEGHTEVREEQQIDCWNEEEEDLDRRMRERLEERLCMSCELDIGVPDVDDDGYVDDSNHISVNLTRWTVMKFQLHTVLSAKLLESECLTEKM